MTTMLEAPVLWGNGKVELGTEYIVKRLFFPSHGRLDRRVNTEARTGRSRRHGLVVLVGAVVRVPRLQEADVVPSRGVMATGFLKLVNQSRRDGFVGPYDFVPETPEQRARTTCFSLATTS
jgi:hypothetical protein